jgi:hypothetical protein
LASSVVVPDARADRARASVSETSASVVAARVETTVVMMPPVS